MKPPESPARVPSTLHLLPEDTILQKGGEMGEIGHRGSQMRDRPEAQLKFGKVIRTPAMQAGLVARRLRFRDIFRSSAPGVIDAVNNI